jgi:tripartite ATP-independent transporter DctP family solute receptor
MRKKILKSTTFVLVLMFVLVGFLNACGSTTQASKSGTTSTAAPETEASVPAPPKEKIVIRISHSTAADSHWQWGIDEFTKRLEEKTGGMVTTESFPNAMLGADREQLENLQLGTMDAQMTATADVSNFYPQISVFDMPFIYRDTEHAYAVLDGELGMDMLANLDSVGLKAFAYWENGFRTINSAKGLVRSPADLKGLKIRTQAVPMFVEFWTALGANPTPMAKNELYTALQQGTVDAQENPVNTIYTEKFHEVGPYISMTEHYYGPALLVFSKKYFDGLPQEYQTAIIESVKEVAPLQREYNKNWNDECLQKCIEEDCTVVYHNEVDVAAFDAIAKPIREKYAKELGVEDVLNSIISDY